MLVDILKRLSDKAEQDDNAYWERQEDFIQRKDILWQDLPIGKKFISVSISMLVLALFLFITNTI
jgi:hypothetical protein